MASKLKTEAEIAILRTGGRRLAQILSQVARAVRPGVITGELDDLARELIAEQDGDQPFVSVLLQTPLFKNDELPLAALNFLVNKIVNRVPTDRIRLGIKIVEPKPST